MKLGTFVTKCYKFPCYTYDSGARGMGWGGWVGGRAGVVWGEAEWGQGAVPHVTVTCDAVVYSNI